MRAITAEVRDALENAKIHLDEATKYHAQPSIDTIAPAAVSLYSALERLVEVVDQIDDRLEKLESPR